MPGQIVYGQLLVTVNVQANESQRKELERTTIKKIHGFGIISIGKTVVVLFQIFRGMGWLSDKEKGHYYILY